MKASAAVARHPAASSVDAFPIPDLVVIKVGGSVLRTPEDAAVVASEIYRWVRLGRRVLAVVSALGGHTDRLLADARAMGLPHENDLLPGYVALGEEKAAALVAIACDRAGLDACALSVRELGLVAEGPVEDARPVRLDGRRLRAALESHQAVIAPGFAGVRPDGRVALLGRGGTDLTAVFLAAQLGLDRVRLVKDVDALCEADPKAGGPVRVFARADWDQALALGGRLVQARAVEAARAGGVELEIAAPGRDPGTVIGAVAGRPSHRAPQRRLRVAVAGCGVVGGGALARLLADPSVEVTGVLVRDPKKPRDVEAADGLITADPAALLDARPDVLLEAMSEGRAGHDLIRAALSRGIAVASANKQAISLDPAGLQALARDNGVELLYSAAVGGGSPMVETVRAARAAGPIARFEAVLNGTVNFMLSRMDAGESFETALAAARAAGFAEEDPSADLDGPDSAAKVRLLAFEAFGRIPDATPCDALRADEVRRDLKQISSCVASADGALEAAVRLAPAAGDPLFGALKGERNALRVVGVDGRIWSCRGRGAGRWPTAESLLADLADLARARRV